MPPNSVPAPPEDPFLQAELDRVLEPYKGLLSPEMLLDLRELLGDALTTHPTASRVFDRTRPRVPRQKSGDAVKEHGAGAPARDGDVGSAKGGKRR